MKYYIYLLLFLSNFAYGQYQDLDPSIVKLCENIDKIQSIMKVYEPSIQVVTSPVPPFTGLVYGMVAKTNVVVELCNFVNDFQNLNTQGKIRLSKNFTNTLTANKWDAHFQQAEATWDFAENAYDFENGESRPGYLASAQGGRDISDFMNTSKEYYDGHISKEKQAESNEQVRELTQVMANKNILANAINCPEVEDNPNYKKIYENDIKPHELILEDASNDVDYFKQQLLDIGPKFLQSQADLYNYTDFVHRIEKLGVNIGVKVSTKVEETIKPGPLDSKGKPKVKKVAITRPVHSYSVDLQSSVFQNFLDTYTEKWSDWITYMRLTKTSEVGLFNVEERLTKELRNVYYECKESKLMAGVKPESSGYDLLYDKKKKDCQENLKIDEKTAVNLIEYYVTNYKNSLYRKHNSKAIIWTLESDLLGVNRYSPDADGKNSPTSNFQSENIKCANELSPIQLDKIDLAQKNNTLKMKEIIAKNKAKKLQMTQSKMKAEFQYKEDLKKRVQFFDNERLRESKKNNSTGTLLMSPRKEK